MSGVEPVPHQTHARPATRAVSFLLLALAGGLVLAACGGEAELSQAEYEREVDEARQEVEKAFDEAGGELQGVGNGSASLDTAADRLDDVRSRLDAAADELDEVEPPDDAREEHDRLVSGLRDLSVDFGEFREALDTGSVSRIQEFVEDFGDLDSVERIDEAIDDLEAQGYRVDGGR